ncbi:MAG: pyruvate formate-lyase-activating protein [Oscillospiraceae bacterium]|jgi:pyruvate formate lyase activating enzyme
MVTGNIHSIESMGLVDGPGIRTVIFLQGCRLRCQYCHNPDTWQLDGGKTMTPDELVEMLIRYKAYYKSSGGGVTFSGGEPLLQRAFLLESLKRCKEAGIHTCIDTSGYGVGGYEEILAYTDLVLYDVKHTTSEEYHTVTGAAMDETLRFLQAAQTANVPLWIRHVVVPGLTDGEAHIRALGQYIKGIRGVQRVELLPYHLLGVNKYRVMGQAYPLEGVPAMDEETIKQYQHLLDDVIGG